MRSTLGKASLLAVGTIAAFATLAPAQQREGAVRKAQRAVGEAVEDTTRAATGTRLRGTVVRVEGDNQFILRSDEGRNVTFYTNPQTRYNLGVENATLEALRRGSNIDVTYDVRDDRYIVNSVSAIEASTEPAEPRTKRTRVETTTEKSQAHVVRGRLVRVMTEPIRLVVMGEDGNAVTIHLKDQQEIEATVLDQDGRYFLEAIAAAGVERDRVEAETEVRTTDKVETTGTTVEGTIVRVQGTDNQFVLRTSDGKEITFYSDPKAVIRMDERTVPITEFREGTQARVVYEPRGARKIARSIFGGKARNR